MIVECDICKEKSRIWLCDSCFDKKIILTYTSLTNQLLYYKRKCAVLERQRDKLENKINYGG